uniref:Sushi domain-containing protein n=1 Tax=Laticauda laticaudata TaxID=8630 RepID=A0A8C5SUA0_LATLA
MFLSWPFWLYCFHAQPRVISLLDLVGWADGFGEKEFLKYPSPILGRTSSKMNSFPVGSLVQYKCNPGYVKHPRMNASSICIRNQVWSEVQEFCKKKSCGHPGEPENGRLIVSGDFLFGSTLNYTCEEGYKLKGQTSRQCALNGKRVQWSGSLPKCHPILCSSPPNIPHSKNTGKSLKYFFYGTTVTYTCDKGYPAIGNSSIYCTSKDRITGEWSGLDGMWDPPIPVCEFGKESGFSVLLISPEFFKTKLTSLADCAKFLVGFSHFHVYIRNKCSLHQNFMFRPNANYDKEILDK